MFQSLQSFPGDRAWSSTEVWWTSAVVLSTSVDLDETFHSTRRPDVKMTCDRRWQTYNKLHRSCNTHLTTFSTPTTTDAPSTTDDYLLSTDLRSFVIRFDFELYVRFEIRFVLMVRFENNSKFSNRPRCQASFVKKRLVVVKFAFKVDFGSKISVQQHCLTRFMTELK